LKKFKVHYFLKKPAKRQNGLFLSGKHNIRKLFIAKKREYYPHELPEVVRALK
jgi:hypothetical protein